MRRMSLHWSFCSSYYALLSIFFHFSIILKFLWIDCSGFRSPVAQDVLAGSWLTSGSSLGHSLCSQSGCDNSILWRLKGGGERHRRVLLVLLLTRYRTHPNKHKLVCSGPVETSLPSCPRVVCLCVWLSASLYIFSYFPFHFRGDIEVIFQFHYP